MFTISTCSGTWLTISPSCVGSGLSIGLIYPDVSGSTRLLHCGTPVISAYGTNKLGDTSCIHSNIVGDITLPPRDNKGWTKYVINPVHSDIAIRDGYVEYRRTGSSSTARVLGFFQTQGRADVRGWRIDPVGPPGKKWVVDSNNFYTFAGGTFRTVPTIRSWFRVNWYTSANAASAASTVPYVFMTQTFWIESNLVTGSTRTVVKQVQNLHLFSPIVNAPSWDESTSSGASYFGSYDCRTYSFDGSGYSKKEVYAIRDGILCQARARFARFKEYSGSWDSLAWTCVNNMQAVSINSLAYVADLTKLVKLVVDIWSGNAPDLTQDFKNLTLKGVAKKWLSGRYGLRLTISDTESLVKAIMRLRVQNYPYKVVRAAEDWSAAFGPYGYQVLHAKYKVYYRESDNPVRALVTESWDSDIALTFENIWDLVPLSFIFDWVINIQERLRYLDNLTYVKSVEVGGVCCSYKTDRTPIGDGYVPSGLFWTGYKRISKPQLDNIRMPSLFPDHGNAINIIDGASLIISLLH